MQFKNVQYSREDIGKANVKLLTAKGIRFRHSTMLLNVVYHYIFRKVFSLSLFVKNF